VKAVLILLTLEVFSSQVEHLSVVPPKKASHNDIEEVGDDHLCPVDRAPNVQRSDADNPCCRAGRFVVVGYVERHKDGDANDSKHKEHVATHADESDKDGGVHADLVHEDLFPRLHDGGNPCPRALSYRGRAVLLIRVFELRGVDCLMIGSNEREKNYDSCGYAEGQSQGGDDRCRRKLQNKSWLVCSW
jgi:hypothetical protein